jgi:hypothetical protein
VPTTSSPRKLTPTGWKTPLRAGRNRSYHRIERLLDRIGAAQGTK